MIDNLQGIRTMLKISSLGSLRKAAEALKIDPSTVSKSLKRLESDLNLRLFHRGPRHLTLTRNGEEFLEQIKPILMQFDITIKEITEDKDKLKGSLCISSPVVYGERVLLPLIIEFRRQYPDVELDLRFTNRLIDLDSEGIDVAFRMESQKLKRSSPHHYIKTIKMIDFALYASEDYLNRYGYPTTPEDLSEHLLLSLGNDPDNWRFRGPDGLMSNIKVDSNFRINSSPGILEAIRKGCGIGRVPEYLLSAEEARQLVPVLRKYQLEPFNLYLVTREREKENPLISKFIQTTAI